MDESKYIYNELADTAAENAANRHTDFSILKRDSNAKHKVTRIARRLATIEASTWKDDNDFNKFHGKSFERLKESKVEVLESQAKTVFDNTSGGNTHSLFADGKWH